VAYSTKEKIAHVYRRLGMGAHPDLVAATESVEDAIARALSLDYEAPPLPEMEVPMSREDAQDVATLAGPLRWWLTSMVSSPRLIEERMAWFWHDHFATSVRKVRIPYLMWKQHLTIRAHATGSFAELLRAVAVDPAMLFYLDGAHNQVESINENYARELMELHTMGTGNYTQTDVVEAARALTGWVVKVPYARSASRFPADLPPWESIFAPFRHDEGSKTLLGVTGNLDLDDVMEILLDQPATSRFVASKVWEELVGTSPEPSTLDGVAAIFAVDYSIMALIEAIAATPDFVSDEAIRAKVRTPVERLVAVAQGLGGDELDERLGFALHGMAYLPFNPPNPAGFPRGRVLLGPQQMVHSFDLVAAAQPNGYQETGEILARIGLFDVSGDTRRVLDLAPDPSTRLALAVNSPEFALV